MINIRPTKAMSANVELRVSDASGRIVDVTSQQSTDLLRVDVRGLASGAYQVEITDQGKRSTGRFIKE